MTDDGWGNGWGDGWGDDPDDKKVGYKKPPKHSQFKPGKSGNPKGRKPKAKDSKTLCREVISETKEITENGIKQKMPLEKIIYKMVIASALKGNPSSMKMALSLIKEHGFTEELDPSAREMVIRLVRAQDKDKKE
jgi:hypothetical protein